MPLLRPSYAIFIYIFLCSIVRSEVWQTHVYNTSWGDRNSCQWGQDNQANAIKNKYVQTNWNLLNNAQTSYVGYNPNYTKTVTLIGHEKEIIEVMNILKAKSQIKDIEATFVKYDNKQFTTLETFNVDYNLLLNLLKDYYICAHFNKDSEPPWSFKYKGIPIKEADIVTKYNVNRNNVREIEDKSNKPEVLYNKLYDYYEIYLPKEVVEPVNIKLETTKNRDEQTTIIEEKGFNDITTVLAQENQVLSNPYNVYGSEQKYQQNDYYSLNQVEPNCINGYNSIKSGAFTKHTNSVKSQYFLPKYDSKVKCYIHESEPMHHYSYGNVLQELPFDKDPEKTVTDNTYNSDPNINSITAALRNNYFTFDNQNLKPTVIDTDTNYNFVSKDNHTNGLYSILDSCYYKNLGIIDQNALSNCIQSQPYACYNVNHPRSNELHTYMPKESSITNYDDIATPNYYQNPKENTNIESNPYKYFTSPYKQSLLLNPGHINSLTSFYQNYPLKTSYEFNNINPAHQSLFPVSTQTYNINNQPNFEINYPLRDSTIFKIIDNYHEVETNTDNNMLTDQYPVGVNPYIAQITYGQPYEKFLIQNLKNAPFSNVYVDTNSLPTYKNTQDNVFQRFPNNLIPNTNFVPNYYKTYSSSSTKSQLEPNQSNIILYINSQTEPTNYKNIIPTEIVKDVPLTYETFPNGITLPLESNYKYEENSNRFNYEDQPSCVTFKPYLSSNIYDSPIKSNTINPFKQSMFENPSIISTLSNNCLPNFEMNPDNKNIFFNFYQNPITPYQKTPIISDETLEHTPLILIDDKYINTPDLKNVVDYSEQLKYPFTKATVNLLPSNMKYDPFQNTHLQNLPNQYTSTDLYPKYNNIYQYLYSNNLETKHPFQSLLTTDLNKYPAKRQSYQESSGIYPQGNINDPNTDIDKTVFNPNIYSYPSLSGSTVLSNPLFNSYTTYKKDNEFSPINSLPYNNEIPSLPLTPFSYLPNCKTRRPYFYQNQYTSLYETENINANILNTNGMPNLAHFDKSGQFSCSIPTTKLNNQELFSKRADSAIETAPKYEFDACNTNPLINDVNTLLKPVNQYYDLKPNIELPMLIPRSNTIVTPEQEYYNRPRPDMENRLKGKKLITDYNIFDKMLNSYDNNELKSKDKVYFNEKAPSNVGSDAFLNKNPINNYVDEYPIYDTKIDNYQHSKIETYENAALMNDPDKIGRNIYDIYPKKYETPFGLVNNANLYNGDKINYWCNKYTSELPLKIYGNDYRLYDSNNINPNIKTKQSPAFITPIEMTYSCPNNMYKTPAYLFNNSANNFEYNNDKTNYWKSTPYKILSNDINDMIINQNNLYEYQQSKLRGYEFVPSEEMSNTSPYITGGGLFNIAPNMNKMMEGAQTSLLINTGNNFNNEKSSWYGKSPYSINVKGYPLYDKEIYKNKQSECNNYESVRPSELYSNCNEKRGSPLDVALNIYPAQSYKTRINVFFPYNNDKTDKRNFQLQKPYLTTFTPTETITFSLLNEISTDKNRIQYSSNDEIVRNEFMTTDAINKNDAFNKPVYRITMDMESSIPMGNPGFYSSPFNPSSSFTPSPIVSFYNNAVSLKTNSIKSRIDDKAQYCDESPSIASIQPLLGSIIRNEISNQPYYESNKETNTYENFNANFYSLPAIKTPKDEPSTSYPSLSYNPSQAFPSIINAVSTLQSDLDKSKSGNKEDPYYKKSPTLISAQPDMLDSIKPDIYSPSYYESNKERKIYKTNDIKWPTLIQNQATYYSTSYTPTKITPFYNNNMNLLQSNKMYSSYNNNVIQNLGRPSRMDVLPGMEGSFRTNEISNQPSYETNKDALTNTVPFNSFDDNGSTIKSNPGDMSSYDAAVTYLSPINNGAVIHNIGSIPYSHVNTSPYTTRDNNIRNFKSDDDRFVNFNKNKVFNPSTDQNKASNGAVNFNKGELYNSVTKVTPNDLPQYDISDETLNTRKSSDSNSYITNKPLENTYKYSPIISNSGVIDWSSATAANPSSYRTNEYLSSYYKPFDSSRINIDNFPSAKLFYSAIDAQPINLDITNREKPILLNQPCSTYYDINKIPVNQFYNPISDLENIGAINVADLSNVDPKEITKKEFNNAINNENVRKVITEEMKNKLLSDKVIDKLYNLKSPVTLDLCNIGVAKYIPDSCENQFIIPTDDPNIEIRGFQSKFKVIKAKTVIDMSEFNVNNFVAIIKCNYKKNYDDVMSKVKEVLKNKYGDAIVIKDFVKSDPYAVVCDVNPMDLNNNFNILWPAYDGNFCRNNHKNYVY